MSGLSIIPPGFPSSLLRPFPTWVRFRSRSSYTIGTPAIPGDFLFNPFGGQLPSNFAVAFNFTWAGAVTFPFAPGYGRSVLRWSFQGISAKRWAFVSPPVSGVTPLQVPIAPALINPMLSELRFNVKFAFTGNLAPDIGSIGFYGFAFTDWNSFGSGGTAVSQWPDLSAHSYIGLLIAKNSGAIQIACKAAGTVGRTVIADLGTLLTATPTAIDHQFTAATMLSPARYVARLNGEIVADFSFDQPGAPTYNAAAQGIAPVMYGTYFDAGTAASHFDDLFGMDVIAGAGANTLPID